MMTEAPQIPHDFSADIQEFLRACLALAQSGASAFFLHIAFLKFLVNISKGKVSVYHNIPGWGALIT